MAIKRSNSLFKISHHLTPKQKITYTILQEDFSSHILEFGFCRTGNE